jgi:hypothetical protein
MAVLAAAILASGGFGYSAETKKEKAKQLKQAAKKAKLLEMKKDEKKPDPPKAPKIEPATPVSALKPAYIGNKHDAVAVAAFIDKQIDAKLKAEGIVASPICDDAEFLRRVYLDIAGVIPSASQTKAFLDDKNPGKRAKLIDNLLDSPAYGRHQADLWSNLLIRKNSDNRKVDFSSFTDWLEKEFSKNTPWSTMAKEMVSSTGTQTQNPAVGFTLSNNGVDKLADEVGKVFLGQSIQCAQCHNHPFTDYKQTEYWALAAFFIKTTAGGLNTNKGQTPGVQEVNNLKRGKKNELPESYKDVPAQFLRGDQPKLNSSEPYRPALASWLTSPSNPFFAKAMVNRTWAQFFGVGFVNPVDDMRPQNKASHPELLEALAADFSMNGYDVKHLIRGICNSNAYQRSSKALPGNSDRDDALFARMTMKIMTPEQLFDSLVTAVGGDADVKKPNRPAKGPNGGARQQFVSFFLSGAETANTTEYEPGIPQALRLINSKPINQSRFVQALSKADPEKSIEELYLTALNRKPTSSERNRMMEFVKKTPGSESYGDILWVLVNCSEFTMIR